MGILKTNEDAEQIYGARIKKYLSKKTVSKDKSMASLPGGLVYEAERLNMSMWDLMAVLDEMCHKGTAKETDDSTYLVV